MIIHKHEDAIAIAQAALESAKSARETAARSYEDADRNCAIIGKIAGQCDELGVARWWVKQAFQHTGEADTRIGQVQCAESAVARDNRREDVSAATMNALAAQAAAANAQAAAQSVSKILNDLAEGRLPSVHFDQ